MDIFSSGSAGIKHKVPSVRYRNIFSHFGSYSTPAEKGPKCCSVLATLPFQRAISNDCIAVLKDRGGDTHWLSNCSTFHRVRK